MFNDDDYKAICEPDLEFFDECHKMQHHFELLEIKSNSKHYKTAYGIDIANEIQNALKTTDLSSKYGISKQSISKVDFNQNFNGYLLLAKV